MEKEVRQMIAVCTCQCGSVDSLVRSFLRSVGYHDWLNIPIHRGKEKSRALLNNLPPVPEKEMLASFLRDASKWAVIIGFDNNSAKWSDIAHNGAKSKIEAEYVVKNYAELTKSVH